MLPRPQPALARGARILILVKPFPGTDWDSLFLASILAREPAGVKRLDISAMTIHQQDKLLTFFPPEQRLTFDVVFSQENGHLIGCDAARLANLTVHELSTVLCEPLHANTTPRPALEQDTNVVIPRAAITGGGPGEHRAQTFSPTPVAEIAARRS